MEILGSERKKHLLGEGGGGKYQMLKGLFPVSKEPLKL